LILAGLRVHADDVRLLIEQLGKTPLAYKLREAHGEDPKMIVALCVQERVEILAALDDPPARLRPLKATLLEQFKKREQTRGEGTRQPRGHRHGLSKEGAAAVPGTSGSNGRK